MLTDKLVGDVYDFEEIIGKYVNKVLIFLTLPDSVLNL
jgi:hypothetical protein